MLNQRQIGAYISKLRKEKDMTQGQLADELNISHQAVSKWERGDSLPDIGTLDELSRYFGKTIDQLLSPSISTASSHMNTFVRHIKEDHPAQAAAVVNQDHPDTLIDLAPLIKTSDLEQVTERVNPGALTTSQLVELAPFVGAPILDSLVESHKNETDIETIMELSPFISRDLLLQLLNSAAEEKLTLQQICDLAPFLGRATGNYLGQSDLSNMTWREINDLAPFIDGPALKKLISAEAGSITLEKMVDIAPFLGEDLDELLEKIDDSELSWRVIEELAPFISRPLLGRLVKRMGNEKLNLTMAVELAPFLSREDLENCLSRAEGPLTPAAIAELAPFISKETMKKLLEALPK